MEVKELDMAKYTPSLRLGQWFMSKGLYVHSQSYNLSEANKAYNQSKM